MRAVIVLLLLTAAGLAGCVAEPGDTPDDPVDLDTWRVVAEARATPENVSASEVSIAVDPIDPRHAVAAANSQGGFGVYVTRDGGATWKAQVYAAARVDPGPNGQGRFAGLSDPVVAFEADGTVWLAGLAIIPTSSVWVASSDDGGTTWSDGIIVHESDLAGSFNDKEWLGIHPETGTMLVTWQKEPLIDSLRSVEASTGADVDVGDVVVSRSTDGGQTWSLFEKVSRGFHSNGTQVAYTADGRTHLLWVNYEDGGTLDYAYSDDDGATFSDPKPVASVDVVPPFDRYGRMHTLPALVADANGTSLYAVWHDERNGDADVYSVASHDAGATWGDEVRVPAGAAGDGVIQLYPWAAVDADGRLHVTYYDAAADPDCPLFHYAHAVSDDGGASFAYPGNLSSEGFSVFQSSACGNQMGHSFGDYTGAAGGPAGVYAAWADGRHEETSVYVARTSLVPIG